VDHLDVLITVCLHTHRNHYYHYYRYNYLY
jgi:hypothetical protein